MVGGPAIASEHLCSPQPSHMDCWLGDQLQGELICHPFQSQAESAVTSMITQTAFCYNTVFVWPQSMNSRLLGEIAQIC